MTAEIAIEAFEQSCNMRPEWARWLIPQGVDENELAEASMIFAIRPGNIHSIPKVISLLGAMHIVTALPAKETPMQCANCRKWRHKQENCAKRTQCYYRSSEKHTSSDHKCEENECRDGNLPCPHPPKCIICNGPHQANYKQCPLGLTYSKAKSSIQKANSLEVARVRAQQKLLRDRLTRDNCMQYEVGAQSSAASNQVTRKASKTAKSKESQTTIIRLADPGVKRKKPEREKYICH